MSAPIKVANESKKKYGNEIAKYKVDHLHRLDCDLGNLASSMEIDIMPGEADLSTVTLPQRAVPSALLPATSAFDTVKFTTNPALFDVESVR